MLLPFLKMKQSKTEQYIAIQLCASPSVVINTEDSPNETNNSSESAYCLSQIQVKYFKKEYKRLVAKNKDYFSINVYCINYKSMLYFMKIFFLNLCTALHFASKSLVNKLAAHPWP
jgi:hypothetical protein